jgi:hypothetical protein
MASTSKLAIEAGGTVNGPTRLSIAVPCSIKVDDICAVAMKKTTIDAHTAHRHSSFFTSST